ncbi:MAG TPA: twin-arginine translocation signal domain-containing protein [Anaerolineae bacterium]
MKKSTRREFLRYAGMGAAAAVVTACAGPATPGSTPAPAAPAAPPTAAAAAATAAPTAAVKATAAPATAAAKTPLTLSYWTQLDTNPAAVVKNYNEIGCYKELEKITGIHIDFQHVSVPQATEQFNLMIASGKYPDLIETNWLTVPGGPAKAIKDGVIVRLNDLIDKNAPNLKKVLADHPDWRKQVLTDEGDIYCFPFLRGDPYLLTFSGPTVRKDWLDKLNLTMPATVDEWHDMLVAFKTKDPNGNGKPDERPYSPWYSEGSRSARSAWYRGFLFGAYGILMEWYQEKGVVKFGALQPQFKDALKVLAQWYKEGLIDPDYVSADQKGIDAQISGSILGATSMNTGGGIGKYTPVLAAKDPKAKLAPAPYPVLKKGDKPLFGQRDNVFPGQGSVAISTACKNPAEAVKWLDYGYGDAGHLLFNFGIEGTSYKMVDGKPIYTDAIMKDPKLPPVSAMSLYIRAHYNGPFVQDKGYIEQYSVLPEQKAAIAIWSEPSNEGRLPPTTPTQAESKKLATIMQDVMTRYEEVFHKVVTGALPVDAWDQYVKDIKGMGIDDAVKIQQAALDRYNKRA